MRRRRAWSVDDFDVMEIRRCGAGTTGKVDEIWRRRGLVRVSTRLRVRVRLYKYDVSVYDVHYRYLGHYVE